CRAPKVIDEPRIHVENLPAERGFLMQHTLREAARRIQGEVLDRLVIFESAPLPPARGPALDNEERGTPAMLGHAVEQCPQDFFLSAARMNGRYPTQQICGSRRICVVSRLIRSLRQFCQYTPHQLIAQLRKVALQDLGDHTFDHVREFVLLSHGSWRSSKRPGSCPAKS